MNYCSFFFISCYITTFFEMVFNNLFIQLLVLHTLKPCNTHTSQYIHNFTHKICMKFIRYVFSPHLYPIYYIYITSLYRDKIKYVYCLFKKTYLNYCIIFYLEIKLKRIMNIWLLFNYLIILINMVTYCLNCITYSTYIHVFQISLFIKLFHMGSMITVYSPHSKYSFY